MIPLRPCSITSGTAPQRVAITGVPHAIDSIITRPNGSSHSIGNRVARAFCSSSTFSPCVTSPRNSIPSMRWGSTNSWKYARSLGSCSLPAIFKGSPAWIATVWLQGIDGEVERVVAVRDPVQVRLRLPLVHGDRDQADTRSDTADQLVDLPRLSVERPVNRVDDGCRDDGAQRAAEHPRVIVDHIELGRAVVAGERVPELPGGLADLAARRLSVDRCKLRPRPGISGREQRYVMTRVDQPVREQRDDPFDAAVARRRNSEPGWGEDRDPHALTPFKLPRL